MAPGNLAVGLVEGLVVDQDLSRIDADALAGERDDALHQDGLAARQGDGHDVAAADLAVNR